MIKLLLDKQSFAFSDARFCCTIRNDGHNTQNFVLLIPPPPKVQFSRVKTRTTIVVSNGRYTFYQIHFIKHTLSNTIYLPLKTRLDCNSIVILFYHNLYSLLKLRIFGWKLVVVDFMIWDIRLSTLLILYFGLKLPMITQHIYDDRSCPGEQLYFFLTA